MESSCRNSLSFYTFAAHTELQYFGALLLRQTCFRDFAKTRLACFRRFAKTRPVCFANSLKHARRVFANSPKHAGRVFMNSCKRARRNHSKPRGNASALVTRLALVIRSLKYLSTGAAKMPCRAWEPSYLISSTKSSKSSECLSGRGSLTT